ncbi:hypothetical protein AAMO2058_000484100 [Amorphochlora amoebiformis]
MEQKCPSRDFNPGAEGSYRKIPGLAPHWYAILLCSLIPCAGGWAMGMGLGNIGGILASPVFKEAYDSPSSATIQALAGAMPMGSIFGSTMSGYAADRYGRRIVCVGVGFFILVGSAISSLSLVQIKVPLLTLFIGRIIVGLGAGMGYSVVYTISAELSAPWCRGRIQTLVQVFTTLGILTGYLINWVVLLRYPSYWAASLAFQGVIAIPFTASAYLGPESPRWLALRGNFLEATSNLQRVRTPEDDCWEEVRDMSIVAGEPTLKTAGSWSALCTPQNRPMATVGILLNAIQTLSGIDVVTYYAPQIFAGTDVSFERTLFYTVLVGIVYLASTPLSTLTVDCLGRRILLISGSFGMTVCLIGLSLSFAPERFFGEHGLARVILTMSFVCFYSISWGPLGCAVASELVNTPIRAK